MMSIVNLSIFLGVFVLVIKTSSFAAGAILVFILSIVEIMQYGMTHFMFLIMCELTFALFIVKDTKLKKDESLFLKYNPLYKRNVLPPKVQFIACSVFMIAFLVHMVASFQQTHNHGDEETTSRYQKDVNAFIKKIVIAHQKGDDYHSIVKANPFVEDDFVCRIVSLLDSEYATADAMNHSASIAMGYDKDARREALSLISEECIKESSNVVRRIMAAEIGESNAAKMANEFSEWYATLHDKCLRAKEKIERTE